MFVTLHVHSVRATVPHQTTRKNIVWQKHHSQRRSYMVSARRRHWSARLAFWAFTVGAFDSAADRSQCAAASLSSAAERGPASQVPSEIPPSTAARMRLEPLVVPPLRLGHLVALLLLQHVECPCRSICSVLRAHRIALVGLEVPLRGLHLVPRVVERCTEVEVRQGLVGLQGDGLAEGLGCSARVLLRAVPHALSQQLLVRVARLRGVPGLHLRGLAMPLLPLPAILQLLPLLPQLLVKHPVQLPSARVRRAVDAAEVRRRQLLIEALITDGVLLPLVVHV
eukprot:scaffold68635_cov56-Phaeocystis_antarctica.AAC.2